jgi:hypothetical protein
VAERGGRRVQVLSAEGEPCVPPLTDGGITPSSTLCGVSVTAAEPGGIGPLSLLLDAGGRPLAVRVRVADWDANSVHEFA